MTEEFRALTILERPLTLVGDPKDFYFQSMSADIPDYAAFANYLRQYLKPDAICFDVGANIGVTTLLLAALCTKGHVYAFEPGRVNARWLRRNIEVNRLTNCTVVESAVGSTEGKLSFRENRSWSFVSNHPADSSNEVPVTTLDAFARAVPTAQHVDFIKIDVEGYEPHVLAGACDLLSRRRPQIWMEFNSWCLMAVADLNPFWFMSALEGAFDIQMRMPDATLAPVNNGADFLLDNIIHHGCVDDVLLRPKPGASLLSPDEMLHPPTALLRAEVKQLRTEIEALRTSTSWRVTAPLRALKRALRRATLVTSAP